MRLNKYIAACGVASRRKADELIENGDVALNGKPAVPGDKVNVGSDIVTYLGKPLTPNNQLEYYLLHKPTGVVSTCDDPQGRKTVLDYIKTNARLYPVGRLDYESSGLLVITNDGDLTNRVTHPSFEIEKEYSARVKGVLSDEALDKLRTGVIIDGHKTHPAKVRVTSQNGNSSYLTIIIHEGRNRQIRKMVQAVGSHVYALMRVRLGNIALGSLQAGQCRKLTKSEIDYLKGLTP